MLAQTPHGWRLLYAFTDTLAASNLLEGGFPRAPAQRRLPVCYLGPNQPLRRGCGFCPVDESERADLTATGSHECDRFPYT